MGSIISTQMDGVMQKNIDNMAAMQTAMLERQIQMNNYMRERQMAMQLAGQRELFMYWWTPFYAVFLTGCAVGVMKMKKPYPMIPFVPISFMYFYQADMAVGNKMDRIRAEADRILAEEQGVLRLPGPGLPTVDVLDERRKAMKK